LFFVFSARVLPGKQLGVCLPHEVEYLVSFLALAKNGAKIMNLSPDLGVLGMGRIFRQTGIDLRGIVVSGEDNNSNYNNDDNDDSANNAKKRHKKKTDEIKEIIPELKDNPFVGKPICCSEFPNFKLAMHTGHEYEWGFSNFKNIFVDHPMPSPLLKISPTISSNTPVSMYSRLNSVDKRSSYDTDSVVTQFSHGAIIDAALSTVNVLGLNPDDRVCHALPQFMPYGLVVGTMATLAARGVIVLPCRKFDPEKVADVIISEQCTVLAVQETDMLSILDNFSKSQNNTDDSSQLQQVVIIRKDDPGAPVNDIDLDLIHKVLNVDKVHIGTPVFEAIGPVFWKRGLESEGNLGTPIPEIQTRIQKNTNFLELKGSTLLNNINDWVTTNIKVKEHNDNSFSKIFH